MTLQVIGVGLGRTGTLSLKHALEQLGWGPCYHMVELTERPADARLWAKAAAGKLDDWNRVFAGYRSTVDWPGCSFWSELTDAYPDAKVVLTVRDPWRWYASARRTIFSHVTASVPRNLRLLTQVAQRPYGLCQLVAMYRIVRFTFDGSLDDSRSTTAAFVRHGEQVRARVSTDRLLVFDVAQGWEPLCEFLGVDVPAVPFPHVNDAHEFHRLLDEHLGRRGHRALATVATVGLAALTLAALTASRRTRAAHQSDRQI